MPAPISQFLFAVKNGKYKPFLKPYFCGFSNAHQFFTIRCGLGLGFVRRIFLPSSVYLYVFPLLSLSTPANDFCELFTNHLPFIATFDAETRRLMQEVKEKTERLRLNGVSEWIIQRLVLPSEKLSRLVVTSDFRIVLPDYNDMEIKMEPLVKSVYFLFLEHEKGIRFKCLSDYRQRLAYIYNKVLEHSAMTRTVTPKRKEQSLAKVVDPLSNSINEKCARIKASFISMFDEHLANRYYVDGKPGEPKRISLPRELIDMQYCID